MLTRSARTIGVLRVISAQQRLAPPPFSAPTLRLVRSTHTQPPAQRKPWVLSSDRSLPPPASPATATGKKAPPEPPASAAPPPVRVTPAQGAAAPPRPAPGPAQATGARALLRLSRTDVQRLSQSADAGDRSRAGRARWLRRARLLLILGVVLVAAPAAWLAWVQRQPLFCWEAGGGRAAQALLVAWTAGPRGRALTQGMFALARPPVASGGDPPDGHLSDGHPPGGHTAGGQDPAAHLTRLHRILHAVSSGMSAVHARGLSRSEIRLFRALRPEWAGTPALLAALGEGHVSADELVDALADAQAAMDAGTERRDAEAALLRRLVPGGILELRAPPLPPGVVLPPGFRAPEDISVEVVDADVDPEERGGEKSPNRRSV